MIGTIVKFKELSIICLIFAALAPAFAAGQQNKGGPSTDELLKSIGLTKPAFARAPDFNLRDGGGGMASLSGNRGNLILLNFWATWCGPCREEMPSMEQLSRSFGGQGFTILAVNQRESAAQVARYMKTNGLNFRVPLDTDGRVSASYRVYGIPATYLIDANGQAIGMKSGTRDWAAREVVDVFRKLIADGGGSGSVGGSMELEPAAPLPKKLRAKGHGVLVHGQQDAQSEIIGKLDRGDDLIPLGTVSGAGEFWYMVKTKSGAVGWVRGAEVEEVRSQK
jgi:thiol-disulfide isomerase/thioredoxin